MNQGWISLHRKIAEHWIWVSNEPFDKRSAWIDLLLLANHEDKKILLGNELVEVKRGEHITSEYILAQRWGWSRKKVRNFLQLLAEDGMIENIKEDKKRTRLRIVNYNDYQELRNHKRTSEELERNYEGTTEELRGNLNNNDNNENNDNKNIYSQNTTPYEKIIELYNNICKSLPQVKKLTDKRKRTIKARWKQYNDLSIYVEVFKKAEESDFLSGRSGKWSGCNFDWLINENNMIKVLEGNYDNKETKETIKTRFHFNNQRSSKYTAKDLDEIARLKFEKKLREVNSS
ncbi:hypothetical protein [Caloranaerobacter ferrireducens]|uniref:hypothetical protein n=1 Tax=Caloranaerobacter ferrireducens TaxID=1323370 RepID=UPI00084D224C|nr:hypothetical protein [Caloranaerobacter ferrireducens]